MAPKPKYRQARLRQDKTGTVEVREPGPEETAENIATEQTNTEVKKKKTTIKQPKRNAKKASTAVVEAPDDNDDEESDLDVTECESNNALFLFCLAKAEH